MPSEKLEEQLELFWKKWSEVYHKTRPIMEMTDRAWFVQAGGIASVVLAGAIGLIFAPAIPAAIAVGAVGAMAAFSAFVYRRLQPDVDRLAADEWVPFFNDWELFSPAGERVRVVDANKFEFLTVEFEDGTREGPVILSMLTDAHGEFYTSGDSHHVDPGTVGMWLRFSKFKWKTLDGRIGTVRGAGAPRESESYLKLSFGGGQVESIRLSALEPVTD